MHCTECRAEVTERAKFCSECGSSLNPCGSANIISGDGSVNFGQKNQVTGTTININSHGDDTDIAYIDRTKVKPLSLAGTQLKLLGWLSLACLVSLVVSQVFWDL